MEITEKGQHSSQYTQKYFTLENTITESLRNSKILLNLYLGENPRIGRYFINDDRKLQPTEVKKKDPVGMKGKLFEMHADKVSCKLLSVIKAKKELDTKEKEAYKECVKNALIQEFKKPYISTIRSQFNIRNIHKYFYTLSRENKLTAEERDVSIIIAVTLFQKNPNFISANGDVSLEGRQYLQYILQKSLQDTTPSGSKSVSNILHDGDFHFLHHTVTDNVPLLTHFTQFILYLMDEKCFNPYDKHPNGRSKEKREKAKNGLLNDIYMLIINEDAFIPKTVHIEKPENYSDTMHKNTVHLLEPNIIALNKSNKENPKYTGGIWKFSHRKKSPDSKRKKRSKGEGEITDDSGLRATRFGEKHDNQALRNENVLSLFREYFKIKQQQGKSNVSLQLSKKNGFIDNDTFEQVLEDTKAIFPQTKKRRHNAHSLEKLFKKYEAQYDKTLSPDIKKAYQIATGTQRSGNGQYTDVKSIGIWEGGDGKEYEEFSIYDWENEVGIAHTTFYNCWKEIFDSIYKRGNVSLHKLRYKWETAIKARSYILDFEEIRQENGEYLAPNDSYRYIEVDDWETINRLMENNREKNLDQTAQKKAQRILEDTQHIMKKQVCLKDLLYRKEDNDEIFDKIICQIINTGLKENKIMFLNPPTGEPCKFITPKDLKTSQVLESIRFITSEALEELSINPDYLQYRIGIYDTELNTFSECVLGDIGILSTLLEKPSKSEPDNEICF